jgi:hypothetical protein
MTTTSTLGRAAVARVPRLLFEITGRLDRRGPASPWGALWAAARPAVSGDGTSYCSSDARVQRRQIDSQGRQTWGRTGARRWVRKGRRGTRKCPQSVGGADEAGAWMGQG